MEELMRAGQYLRDHYPGMNEHFRIEMWNRQRQYPSAWFKIAYKRMRAKELEEEKVIVRSFSLFDSMLGQFVQQGGPGRGIEDGYTDGMVKIRASKVDYLNAAVMGQLDRLGGVDVKTG